MYKNKPLQSRQIKIEAIITMQTEPKFFNTNENSHYQYWGIDCRELSLDQIVVF
jgi:hypothetical protein